MSYLVLCRTAGGIPGPDDIHLEDTGRDILQGWLLELAEAPHSGNLGSPDSGNIYS